MIEEPPRLTIAAPDRRRRPTAGQIDAFRGIATGIVVDALDGVGALSFEIKPLPGLPAAIAGPALTCENAPGDIMGMLATLGQISPGDVVVSATGGWRGCAALGDRVAMMARNQGALGWVTDGLARDIDGIEAVGLPVFCAGISPNSPHSTGPGQVALPVVMGGVRVETGDMIVTDRDGVVVVPHAALDAVIARLPHILALETENEIAPGSKLPEAIAAIAAGTDVRWV